MAVEKVRYGWTLKCAGLVLVSALQGCCLFGAGSSCDPHQPATVQGSGFVIAGGPIQGATVCADLNSNGICDAGEPVSGVTGADGFYGINAPVSTGLYASDGEARARATSAHNNEGNGASGQSAKPENFVTYNEPAVVQSSFVAMVPANAVDASRPNETVGTAYALRVPFGSGGVISPFTTLVQAGVLQGLTRVDAEAAVRAQLQLGAVDWQGNYTASGPAANPALVALASSVVATLQAGAPVLVTPPAAAAVDYFVRAFSYVNANNYTLRYFYAPTAPAGSGLYSFYDVRTGLAGGAPVAASTLYDSALLSSPQGWAPNTGASVHTITGGSPSVLTYSTGYSYVVTRTVSDVAGQSLADVVRLVQDLTVNTSSSLVGVNPVTLTRNLPAGSKAQKITTVGTATPISYRVSDGFVGAPVATLAAMTTAYPAPSVPTSANTLSMGSVRGSAGCSTVICPQESMRVAFAPGNGATYYLCDVEASTGTQSNCQTAGNGTYTLGAAADNATPVMTFANLPAAASVQTNSRVFVERNGRVYFGFKDKTVTATQTRLNQVAFEALAAALGITPPAISPVPSPYIGAWTAAYSGADSGSCPVGGIDAVGRLSGACSSTITGQSFVVGGTVSPNGAADFTSSGGSSTGARFTGTLSGSAGAGTWVLPSAAASGSWTAAKQP